MHRTAKVALSGAALSWGVVLGLPSAALAATLDCTLAEVRAAYPEKCLAQPGQLPDRTEQPGGIGGSDGGAGTGGGGAGEGTAGGGTAGGGTSGGGLSGGDTAGGSAGGAGAAGSLPFTGDEILVLSLAGGVALASGAALTVAGRRRRVTTA